MNGMSDFDKELFRELQGINRQLANIREDIGSLKVKSGLFGAIGAGAALLLHWGAQYVLS